MRYGEKHKEESRRQIVSAAASRFRLDGAQNVRVADVMSSVGLTVGGFYHHFENKEELLQVAITSALEQVAHQLVSQIRGLPRAEALRHVIGFYLSEEHVKRPDLGCALAALGSEIARLPKPVRNEISKALEGYADRLSFLMPGKDEKQRKAAFLILFPSMAGCVMTARAHRSRAMRVQMLEGARAFFTAAFCEDDQEAVAGEAL